MKADEALFGESSPLISRSLVESSEAFGTWPRGDAILHPGTMQSQTGDASFMG